MHKVWAIAWNDLRTTLQNKHSWLRLVVVPALFIYLVGLGAQGFARSIPTSIRMDVLDQDDSVASRAFAAALAEASATLRICPAPDDRADGCALAGAALTPALAQERLATEVTFASLTIPKGYATALDRGENVTLVFRSGAALAAPEIALGAVRSVVARLGGPSVAARLSTDATRSYGVETDPEFYAARLAAARDAWGPPPPVQVTTEFTRQNERLLLGAQLLENGFKLSAPSVTAMFVMISILGMAQSLAEERLWGILRRVGMMPVGRAELLGGKLLSTVVLGLVQFAVLLAFGQWLGVDFGGAPWAVMIVAGAYVLAVTAMALTLAGLAQSPGQASAVATLTWVILVPLGGGWWPLTFVPAWMQTLGHLSPVAWCLDGLKALALYRGTWMDVLQPVGALLLFAAVFFAVGVKQFDWVRSGGQDAGPGVPYWGVRGGRDA